MAAIAFDNMFYYLLICLLFFGVGDLLGVATKAKVSAVFVSLFLFLAGFMSGLIPPDIIKKAGLQDLGKIAVIFVVFSMGTTINFRELIAEWRTVATALLSMLAVLICGLVLIPIIGKQETIVSLPIVTGGIVATQIMTNAAMEQGFALAAALGTIIFAIQKFLGSPVASYFGLREARVILAEYRQNKEAFEHDAAAQAAAKATEANKKLTFFERNKKYYGPFTCLAITAFFCWISFLIGKATNLSPTIWALILGAAVSTTGLLPSNILKHANSAGLFNCATFATIIPSLAKITMDDLSTLGMMVVALFVVVFVALFLCFYILPLWKILGSRNVAMGVACCQLLGFPATYLIVNEVAQAAASNEDEKKAITDRLMPKYLVGGFTTVTSFCVIIAGFMAPYV